MAVDISAIHKFNGQNYSQWRFQINCALKAKGVYSVANGESIKPTNDAAKLEKWIKDDAIAMFTISSAMELNQVTLIESCDSSKEMMEKLDSIFKLKSDFNKMLLLDKFHQMKMESNETVVQYIAKIENLAHQIKDSGETISDATIITKILGTLPSKYRNFRQAWLSVDDSKQILSNLTARLIDEEMSLSQSEQAESAFLASNHSKYEVKRHANYQGNENKYKNQSRNFDKSKITCYVCRRKGHYARDCRSTKSREKGDNQRSKNSSNYSAFTSEVGKRVLESTEQWILDSGASAHMTYNLNYFDSFTESSENEAIRLGNNVELPIKGRGSIKIQKNLHGKWQEGKITNVLYVPDLKKNLLSEGVIASKGMKIIKMHDHVEIYDCENELVATATRSPNNLYHMLFKTVISLEANVSSKNDLKMWHERTGHVNLKTLSELSKKGLIEKLDMSDKADFFCEGCQYGKQHRFSFSTKNYKATVPGELIHSDICGPMSTESVGGANYFILLKDDYSGFRKVYFLKHKHDALEAFQNFVQLCENKFSHKVKALRVDNGTEYINLHFGDFLNKKGIQLETAAPYTPQQNGRSERDMRTIVESARSMIYSRELPLYLWAEAVNTAVYILNRTPTTQAPNSTPHELWTGKSASLNHLKIFGSEAYMHVPDKLRKKLEPKSKKMIFVGYEKESKNYRLFDPLTKRIKVSRDVIFNEENTKLKTSPPPSTFLFSFNEDIENDKSSTDEDQDNVTDTSPDPNRDFDSYTLRPRSSLKVPARYEVNVADIAIPNTYEEAMSSPQANNWKEAIQEELNSLEKNKTWDLVLPPESANIIGSKWVFKVKYLPNGKIDRFKARLCAKGFSQVEGVDYSETFSPTSRFDTIRVLLAIAAQKKWKVIQIDVKTAFLHGEIEETIFMEPPPGLDYPENMVCQLKKSLYGLKQASRCWNKTFSEFLTSYGFKQSIADSCVFKGIFQGKKVLLILYVDDALLFCEEKEVLIKIVEDLRNNFETTVCETGNFVGMEIEYKPNGSIFIHSKNYIKSILRRFNFDDASSSCIPADPGTILSLESNSLPEGKTFPYREAIGSLMYLSITTRPDIAFAVNVASRFQANPGQVHWNAVKRIFRYLKSTAAYGIEYSSATDCLCQLIGYSDADFANDVDSRKSTSGYVFKISNGPVTWCSQKQTAVSTSTTEAEYIAASTAVKEILWLRQLLIDIDESEISAESVPLFMDNQSAIKLIKNPVFHKRTKHIDVRYHFIREKYEDGSISIKYVKSEEQLADIFTKALPKLKFEKLRECLNIKEIV